MSNEKHQEQDELKSNLPLEILAFLQEVIGSSVMRYDVLKFFYQNPYAIVTISDLTVWMSREERPLAEALQQLARLGYLAQSHASAAYVLTRDLEKRLRMEEFFDYLDANPDKAKLIRNQIRRGTEAY